MENTANTAIIISSVFWQE